MTPVDSQSSGGVVPGCVFCRGGPHPDALFESEQLQVVPDLYPLVPGHVLVITKEHLPCMGAGDDALLAELDGVVAEATAFVRAAYGVEPLMWENGVTGQTVFHAHVHLIPIEVDELLDELVDDSASVEINGWDEVARRYRETGDYHVIRLRGHTWLVEGNGAMNWEGRRRLALAAGMTRTAGKWFRASRPEDVEGVADRWRAWVEAGRPAVSGAAEGLERP